MEATLNCSTCGASAAMDLGSMEAIVKVLHSHMESDCPGAMRIDCGGTLQTGAVFGVPVYAEKDADLGPNILRVRLCAPCGVLVGLNDVHTACGGAP